jgi:hypothetical protein
MNRCEQSRSRQLGAELRIALRFRRQNLIIREQHTLIGNFDLPIILLRFGDGALQRQHRRGIRSRILRDCVGGDEQGQNRGKANACHHRRDLQQSLFSGICFIRTTDWAVDRRSLGLLSKAVRGIYTAARVRVNRSVCSGIREKSIAA